MSLSEALKEETHKGRTRKCRVCDWLQDISEEDRESFVSWVISGRPLAALLRASKRQDPPVPVERDAFERHCRDHVQ